MAPLCGWDYGPRVVGGDAYRSEEAGVRALSLAYWGRRTHRGDAVRFTLGKDHPCRALLITHHVLRGGWKTAWCAKGLFGWTC